MIAALFVDPEGVYAGRDGVECWGEERDARTYPGRAPVVAHPPCQRWGRYATGGPNPQAARRHVGDDGGCFYAALWAVRTFGGVLEHPAASKAWQWFGLQTPPHRGGWIPAGDGMGWTCHVEQGHYGHAAPKATWLYACVDEPPSLTWGRVRGVADYKEPRQRKVDPGFHTAEEARAARAQPTYTPIARLSKKEREATPPAFADLLISIARGVS